MDGDFVAVTQSAADMLEAWTRVLEALVNVTAPLCGSQCDIKTPGSCRILVAVGFVVPYQRIFTVRTFFITWKH